MTYSTPTLALAPMSSIRILTTLAFLFTAFFFLATDALACGCSSGCGMVTDGLSADVKALMQKAKSQGRNPISCIRTQACQDRLRRCYERCGQYGRAARRSAHSDGKACDYSPHHRGPLRQLKGKMGLRNITDLTHRSSHGGGLHVYTTRFTRTAGNTRPDLSQPQPRSNQKLPRREPADGPPMPQPRPGDRYEQMPNGRYRCPSGLRSICGSTRDTPWCQAYIQRGQTPGCYR